MRYEPFGASVQGASHIRNQKECQDRCLCYQISDKFDIIAVSDGHGGKASPYSSKGAEFAVIVFLERMMEYYKHYKENISELRDFLVNDGNVRIAKEIDKRWKAKILDWHLKNHKDEKLIQECGRIDTKAIYRLYGCTLLGMFITDEYVYSYQLGDGDIMFVSGQKAISVIEADKMLGVETHSLSTYNSWENALSAVHSKPGDDVKPYMYMLSSDGLANSYRTDEDFERTCVEYLNSIKENGIYVVKENLDKWLSETSTQGCGDDISTIFAYYD